MLKIGIAGIGFMGMIHYLAAQRVPSVKVIALCSRDKKKLAGDWRAVQGNFGPPGTQMDLTGIRTYEHFDDLLADAEVDLVDICLPPRLHAEASMAASRAGKHVFCEKPIALELDHAERMIEAARKVGKQLLVGHIVPFFPEYSFVLKATRKNKFGKLLGGHFKRLIADPPAAANYFDPQEMGGPLVDLHIHDAHFVRLLFGMPEAVFSCGRTRGSMLEFLETKYLYGEGQPVVSATGGVIGQPGRPFNQGFEVHFEQATVAYDFAVIDGQPQSILPLTVFDTPGGVQRPELGSPDPADGFVAEIHEVAQSIERGQPSALLDGRFACDALRLCQKEAESAKKQQIVKV